MNNSSSPVLQDRWFEKNPAPVVILLVISIINNLILTVGVMAKKSLRTPTYFLVANLAISDILLAATFINTAITRSTAVRDQISLGTRIALCKFSNFAMNLSVVQSMQTLVIISFERYLAILKPTKKLTSKRALTLSLISWLLATVISFPFLILSNIFKNRCHSTFSGTTANIVINFLLVLAEFCFPFTAMGILYGIVLYHFHIKRSILANNSSKSRRAKRKTTYMLLTTTGAFVICMLPWGLTLYIEATTNLSSLDLLNDKRYPVRNLIIGIGPVAYSISVFYNPIIYCIFNRKIRQLYFPCNCSFGNVFVAANITDSNTPKVPVEATSTEVIHRHLSNKYRITPINVLRPVNHLSVHD
ncbi:Neuromedin-K receptor [Trichoplax sp. H2]|nr:Neuromedin-K receptor [Trichoplax sp. H2]|eukprot:RDD46331.1 Neuromedin-K receptor [Trichoplax sp. H2]